MSLNVLGSPLSPYVRKVIALLNIQGKEFELQARITPWDLPEGFDELNPLKRIPVLQHDDKVLADSSVICGYLDDLSPEHSIYSNDPYQKARIAWFEKFADYELGQLLTIQAFRLLLLYPVMGRPVDSDEVRALLAEKVPPLLDYLNSEIGDNNYLVGDQLSIADIATVSQFINFLHSGEQLDTERWPNIGRYLQFHYTSELFAPMLAKEQSIVGKMRKHAGLETA